MAQSKAEQISQFADDCLTFTYGEERTDDIHDAYVEWCADHDIEPLHISVLFRLLNTFYGNRIERKHRRYRGDIYPVYAGVKLADGDWGPGPRFPATAIHDGVTAFADERLEFVDGEFERVDDIYDAYVEWCAEAAMSAPLAIGVFFRRLNAEYGRRIERRRRSFDGEQKTAYDGLRLVG